VDKEILVETQIIDGERLVKELVRDGFDVTVAFWAQSSEESLWYLYISAPWVDPEKIGEAYIPVFDRLSRIPDPSFGISEVRLIPASSPIARAAVGVRDRFPGGTPARFHGKRLGNLSIEEAYIYPAALTSGGPRRKTRIFGRREEPSGGEPRIVEEEVGIVDGVPGEDAFNEGWLRLIHGKFGDLEGFAAQYPNGGRFEFIDR
jgi:hypothetical protein